MAKIINTTKGTNFEKNINIPFIDQSNITLKPGEFLFVEELGNNSSLRIFEKKQLIQIINEDKPNHLSFLKAYNNSDLLKDDYSEVKDNHEEVRNEIINDSNIPKKLREKITLSKESQKKEELNEDKQDLISIEIKVPEEAIKNKGGRPKGSKNSSKRGRPKKKKKPGRPKKRGRPRKR